MTLGHTRVSDSSFIAIFNLWMKSLRVSASYYSTFSPDPILLFYPTVLVFFTRLWYTDVQGE